MPFFWFKQSKHAQPEDRRYRREPRTEQPNPSPIRRRPQVLRQQRCRAKRHRVQFERQFESLPSRTVTLSHIDIHRHADYPEEESCPREISVTLPVKSQLIRTAVEIKRSSIPIDHILGCVSHHEPVHPENPARGRRCRQELPPALQPRSDLDVS